MATTPLMLPVLLSPDTVDKAERETNGIRRGPTGAEPEVFQLRPYRKFAELLFRGTCRYNVATRHLRVPPELPKSAKDTDTKQIA